MSDRHHFLSTFHFFPSDYQRFALWLWIFLELFIPRTGIIYYLIICSSSQCFTDTLSPNKVQACAITTSLFTSLVTCTPDVCFSNSLTYIFLRLLNLYGCFISFQFYFNWDTYIPAYMQLCTWKLYVIILNCSFLPTKQTLIWQRKAYLIISSLGKSCKDQEMQLTRFASANSIQLNILLEHLNYHTHSLKIPKLFFFVPTDFLSWYISLSGCRLKTWCI